MNQVLYPIKDQMISKESKERFLNQSSCAVWFTGLSGSGKSTLALGLEKKLFEEGYFVQLLDGDNVRTGICNNLAFTTEDRNENIRRIAEVAKLFCESGIICLNSFISPTSDMRQLARNIIGPDRFIEIAVTTPIEVCEERDVKGLYKKARAGEIKGFTGIDATYERPSQPDLEIDTSDRNLDDCIEECYNIVIDKIQLA